MHSLLIRCNNKPACGTIIMDKESFYRSEASYRDSVYLDAQSHKEQIR